MPTPTAHKSAGQKIRCQATAQLPFGTPDPPDFSGKHFIYVTGPTVGRVTEPLERQLGVAYHFLGLDRRLERQAWP